MGELNENRFDYCESDIKRVNELIKLQVDKKFVLNRIKKNIDINYIPPFNNELFWKAMILCILSSQQRSGPDSPITNFYSINPFPLSLNDCNSCSDNLSDLCRRHFN